MNAERTCVYSFCCRSVYSVIGSNGGRKQQYLFECVIIKNNTRQRIARDYVREWLVRYMFRTKSGSAISGLKPLVFNFSVGSG